MGNIGMHVDLSSTYELAMRSETCTKGWDLTSYLVSNLFNMFTFIWLSRRSIICFSGLNSETGQATAGHPFLQILYTSQSRYTVQIPPRKQQG